MTSEAAVAQLRRRMGIALRGRHLILFDAIATTTAFILSLALRFDAPSPLFDQYLSTYGWAVPLLVAVRLTAFLLLRLYQRVWQYASVEELIAVVIAVVGSSVLGYAAIYAVVLSTPASAVGFPRTVPIIDTTLMLAFAGAWRFAFRIAGIGRVGALARPATLMRTLIVGSGPAAVPVLRELRSNPSLGFRPVGLLSDDMKTGQRLLGLPIIGRISDLAGAVSSSRAKVVLLALPSADGRTLRRLVRRAQSAGARCLTVPSVAEVVAGRVSVDAIREIEVEDLLRRAPSRIDLASVSQTFAGRCVVVTGGGGSIGGELARQIQRFGPRRLILIGRGENSIFETMQTLQAENGEVVPVILDVRDGRRLRELFESLRPDVIFHAAAHKHVPFMEQFPAEAIATNVVGTLNILDAAVAVRVERLVFISTDKAVNPTSVMGATKRVGELLVQEVAARYGVRYANVRFGNVLSSRGSVVPLFRQQLAHGGPITVTHPDAMRYFMTIPEAVQLVLQAATMATPGDTFVLDMGDPVRIAQLARDLIALHGLEIGEDIELKFIGQRPGEKLVEELFLASESQEATSHEAIWRVRLNGSIHSDLRSAVVGLTQVAIGGSRQEIIAGLGEIVPDFTPALGEMTHPELDDAAEMVRTV